MELTERRSTTQAEWLSRIVRERSATNGAPVRALLSLTRPRRLNGVRATRGTTSHVDDDRELNGSNDVPSPRFHQGVLIVSTLLGSWLGMQAVHEVGHVAAAGWTGGRVERVVLHPLAISRTDLAENPRPLAVVWAGPLVGVTAPLGAWGLARLGGWGGAFVLRFFAGFSLIANGLYIALGSFGRVGDAGEMLRHGSPAWTLWLFGAIAVPCGLWLWHRQGIHFGLGAARGRVSTAATYGSLAACAALLVLGMVVGGE